MDRQMDKILEAWLKQVEEKPIEIGVTLLVSGRIVSGMLTPLCRYEKWQTEVLHRALLKGGKFPVPSSKIPPLTKKQMEDISKHPRKWDVDSVAPVLCLRDVEIQTGVPASWEKRSFLLVSADSVDAFALGNGGLQELEDEED